MVYQDVLREFCSAISVESQGPKPKWVKSDSTKLPSINDNHLRLLEVSVDLSKTWLLT